MGPRIDIESLMKRAEQIRAHSRFAEAKVVFCDRVSHFWLGSPLHRLIIADTGAIAVVITVTGMSHLDPENGASVNAVIEALGGKGIVSATKVRAQIRMLLDAGALELSSHPVDKRRKILRPTTKLSQLHQGWLTANLYAASIICPLPLPAERLGAWPKLVERYLTGVMIRHATDNFTVFTGFPEVEAFMNRRNGYLLMLQLAKTATGPNDLGRTGLAERLGVSRSHASALLAVAEERGWLTRLPPKHSIVLDPEFAGKLETWIARELALFSSFIEQVDEAWTR